MPFLNLIQAPDDTHKTPSKTPRLPKTALVLVNLGTPQSPTPKAVKRYLAEFLSDPRVVEIPRLVWSVILHGIILNVRPKKSAKKYASIWTEHGSPLAVHTAQQAHLLNQYLNQSLNKIDNNNVIHPIMVSHAMNYGSPNLTQTLDNLIRHQGVERLLIVPLYPQYSATTTASVWDTTFKLFSKLRNPPELRLIKHYHDHPDYIQALVHQVQMHWTVYPWKAGEKKMLVMTFHGLPERNLTLGDPYFCECQKTGRLLREALGLNIDEVKITFQSRFGKAKWLQPYTEPTLIQLAKTHARVDLIAPGFTSDCLETLEEINMEVRAAYLSAGGTTFHYIEALNESPEWIKALSHISAEHLQGWV